jgi:hypothetical protein
VPDATALLESQLDGRPEMDTPVEPRECGLLRCLEERAEGTGRKAAIIMCVIRERQRPKQIGEDLRRRTRLDRVFGCVLWERRRHEQGAPRRIDQPTDVRNGSKQVVPELRVPAGNEGIGNGDPGPGVGLGATSRGYPRSLITWVRIETE